MSTLKNIEESNFDETVKNSKVPILVDFWAEWCGPCRALTPLLEEIAAEVGEAAEIVKVNVDNNPGLAQKFNIRGIPTLIFFKDGKVFQTLTGIQPKNEIVKSIKEMIEA